MDVIDGSGIDTSPNVTLTLSIRMLQMRTLISLDINNMDLGLVVRCVIDSTIQCFPSVRSNIFWTFLFLD